MEIKAKIQRVRHLYARGKKYLKYDIWYIGKPGERIPAGFLVKQLRVGILLLRGLWDEALLLRASALTFATLLFLVPFLVFMFSFIQTFHLGDRIYGQVSDWLDSRIDRVVQVVKLTEDAEDLGPGDETGGTGLPGEALDEALDEAQVTAVVGAPAEEVIPQPDTAVDSSNESVPESGTAPVIPGFPVGPQTIPDDDPTTESDRELSDVILHTMFPTFSQDEANGDLVDPVDFLVGMVEDKATDIRTLGLTGLMYILITVLGLMRNVEWSFNQIWGVSETRALLRTLSDYTLITLLLPFVAALMLGITAALTTNDALGSLSFVLRSSQVLIISLTFSLLYYFVPNTSVRPRCALMGGLVAGILWTLTAWAYVTFNVGLARYTFFFSALALFPMLLAWIYTSWVILLFGSLVSFAYQNEKIFALERLASRASFAYRESAALRIMIGMAKCYADGQPAPTALNMAETFNIPTRIINETLQVLVEAGLVTASGKEPVTYQPSRAADKISVLDVLNALREEGEDPSLLREEDDYKDMYDAIHHADPSVRRATVADLVARDA